MAAALQHPIGLSKRLFDARHVANAESDRVGVIFAVAEGQFLGIGFDEIELTRQAFFLGALAPDLEHVAVDVENRDLGFGSASLGHPESDVAGAPGDVEMRKWRSFRRMHPGNEDVLPKAMQTAGHQIVHEVVAVGHLVEDFVDQALLFAERNFGEAEMSLAFAGFLGRGRGGVGHANLFFIAPVDALDQEHEARMDHSAPSRA